MSLLSALDEDRELMVWYRAILITVATIGYKRKPTFEVQPQNHPPMEERIARELLYHTTFRQALIDEGVNPELAVSPSLKNRIRERIRAESEKEKSRRSGMKSRL